MSPVDRQAPLSSIMTTDLIVVNPKDKVKEVAAVFQKHNIHHIPVVSGMHQLEGLISKSDLLKISHGWSLFRNLQEDTYNSALYESLLAQDIMTRAVAKLEPQDTVEMALGIFKENLFHALPIVLNGRLVGIVTTYDLLQYAFDQ